MINISEIFLSIQGESSFAGLPCIFIRFSGCNLNCIYCDTKYHSEICCRLTPLQLIKKISEYLPVKLVEITGGEPLLQDDIYELFELLNDRSYKILLETNGSVLLNKIPDYVYKIVDYKLPCSNEYGKFSDENFRFINLKKDELKFVIATYEDYSVAKRVIQSRKIENSNILFSCVFDLISPDQLVAWILKDKLNIRFQLQMHKYIWNKEQRGV